jgi:hypothetical protein
MRLSSIIAISLVISTPVHALVKQSSSGLCHDKNSSYYSSIKHYTPYKTMDECLNSDGTQLTESTSPQASGYSRDKFGSGWSDIDHDGRDTRQEVLILQNTGNLVFNSEGKVIRGRWVSMYSGKVIVEASAIDIDHIVPLHWAWLNGAYLWSQSKREQFANDERNLVAVESSLNRQKGDKGLDEWFPPTNIAQYKARFRRILNIYDLD